jgi:hypothetical protein
VVANERSFAFFPTSGVSNLLGGDKAAEPQVPGFGHSCSANLRPQCMGAVGGREPPNKTAHFPNGTQLQEQLCRGIQADSL